MPRNTMHKGMTSPTKPGNAVELPLRVPAPFNDFLVHGLGDQVVVRQRDPVALAYLARCDVFLRGGPDGRWGGDDHEVAGERRGEEGVRLQRVGNCWGQRVG